MTINGSAETTQNGAGEPTPSPSPPCRAWRSRSGHWTTAPARCRKTINGSSSTKWAMSGLVSRRQQYAQRNLDVDNPVRLRGCLLLRPGRRQPAQELQLRSPGLDNRRLLVCLTKPFPQIQYGQQKTLGGLSALHRAGADLRPAGGAHQCEIRQPIRLQAAVGFRLVQKLQPVPFLPSRRRP